MLVKGSGIERDRGCGGGSVRASPPFGGLVANRPHRTPGAGGVVRRHLGWSPACVGLDLLHSNACADFAVTSGPSKPRRCRHRARARSRPHLPRMSSRSVVTSTSPSRAPIASSCDSEPHRSRERLTPPRCAPRSTGDRSDSESSASRTGSCIPWWRRSEAPIPEAGLEARDIAHRYGAARHRSRLPCASDRSASTADPGLPKS